MKTKIFLISFLLTLCLISKISIAKSTDERVGDLEKRVESIQRTYFKNNSDVASAIAQSQSVQEEFMALKGSVDANRHIILQQRQDLEQIILDLEHRLTSIEDRLDIFSTQITTALKKVAPKVAREGELYQSGLDKLNAGEYLKAAATFQSFIKKYPKSTFAINAQYWVAECFYAVKDFKRAIKEYQKVIKKSSKHEKGIAALKRQGDCFYEMGMFEEAKVFYGKLIKEFPGSKEALAANNRIKLIDQKQRAKQEQSKNMEQSSTSYPAKTIEQQREKYKQGTPNKKYEEF